MFSEKVQKETVGTESLLFSVNVTASGTSHGYLQLEVGLSVFQNMKFK